MTRRHIRSRYLVLGMSKDSSYSVSADVRCYSMRQARAIFKKHSRGMTVRSICWAGYKPTEEEKANPKVAAYLEQQRCQSMAQLFRVPARMLGESTVSTRSQERARG